MTCWKKLDLLESRACADHFSTIGFVARLHRLDRDRQLPVRKQIE